MKILLAEHAGFCFGVRRAISLAEDAAAAGKRPLYTYGPLVHNQNVVQKLAAAGIRAAEGLEALDGGYLILRAHGVPPGDYYRAAEKNMEVIDATCPFVRRAQEQARELAAEGRQVIIIGEREHVEVKALLAWAGAGTQIVENAAEAAQLPFYPKIGVIVQTTQTKENVAAISAVLRSKTDSLKVLNTICLATQERQEAAASLAKTVDCMLVVGSRTSANTKRLAEICARFAPQTVLVESSQEIKPEWFKGINRVGITAGASTPAWLIKEVIDKMEEIRKEEEGAEIIAAPEDQPAADEGAEKEFSYEESLRTLKEGETVKGTVMSVTQDEVLVDVGYKSEGVLPLKELGQQWVESPEEVVKKGDVIDVYIVSVEDNDGKLILSKRRADEAVAWEKLQDINAAGQTVRGTVKKAIKGGLLADVGVEGFIPASQVDRRYVKDLNEYVGQELDFYIIEMDQAKRRVVLSRRKVLEEQYAQQKSKTLAELEVGQVRTGVVKSLTSFGAFVDLGGVDGLLHISELSWGRVNHPSEVLQVGDQVQVKVLSYDQEKGRIGLGLKQVQADPWTTVSEKYPVGRVLDGKVVRLVKFGAFVELEPGIDGLVHISQMAARRISQPDEVVKAGDVVAVKVINVKPEEKRIGLSMVEAEQDRERAGVQAYLEQQETSGGAASGETAGPEAETAEPETETVKPEAETAGPEAEAAGPEAETAGPEAETAKTETEIAKPETETAETDE